MVLLDLKLPKVDGLEVLKTIRTTDGLKPLPVVMLTSSKEEQDLVRSYELGVNAYVVKPVDFTEFVRAIADLGIFWAVLNEPPPGSQRYVKPEQVSKQASAAAASRGTVSAAGRLAAPAQQMPDARAERVRVIGLLQQIDARLQLALVRQHAFRIARGVQHLRPAAAVRAPARPVAGC